MSPSANASEADPPTTPGTVHGTAVALGGRAVLIRGPSGSGKSDLALRCLALPPVLEGWPRAALVSDDQVVLVRTAGGIEMRAPSTIAGRIEVRGVGIVNVPHVPSAELSLVADLAAPDEVARYPIEPQTAEILGASYPLVRIAPFEASAPVKLLLALGMLPEVSASP